METAAEGDNAGASGMGTGDFHRVFDRFRAGREEGGFCRAFYRRQFVELLRQRHIAFIRHDLIGGMGKLL